jgi:hypothetical protein
MIKRNNNIKHGYYDVSPYYYYGNNTDDSATFLNKVDRALLSKKI